MSDNRRSPSGAGATRAQRAPRADQPRPAPSKPRPAPAAQERPAPGKPRPAPAARVRPARAGNPPAQARPARAGKPPPVPSDQPRPARTDKPRPSRAGAWEPSGAGGSETTDTDGWEPARRGKPAAARGGKPAPAGKPALSGAARPAPPRAGKHARAGAAARARSESEEQGQGGQRRPLSHVGGRIERLEGPEALTSVIRRCLSVHPERGVRDHVHGFHSYPARLHPATAARLIEAFAPARGQVADPFCGSGTVLVEAQRLGRRALGLDLNPLAVRLTRFKTNPLAKAERDDLLDAAMRVAEAAEERRTDAVGPTRQYDPEERAQFDIHVLFELDGLAHGIRKEPAVPIRQALLLALSSIFSKVARQPNVAGKNKRLASGFTLRFFVSRVEELTRQLAEFEALIPAGAPQVECKEGDARELGKLGWRNVDLFISSPPYPGVLDYADYHRARLRWLGLDAAELEQKELGSRRGLQRLDHAAAAARWEQDFTRVLEAMRRALAPRGLAALVLADSMLAGQPYPADDVVERCGTRAGLHVLARGSQRRPHFHPDSAKAFGSRPRYEHLLLLGHAAAPAAG